MSTIGKEFGKSAGKVSGATFLSRILGLIRDQLFAGLLGAGLFSDAYVVAFRIPNLVRDLFAEGTLSAAFIPTFTEYQVKKTREAAWALANLVLGVLLVIVGVLTLLGMIFAPEFVHMIAPGFEEIPGKAEITAFLTRIMFPFLPAVAVSAIFMGILNVNGVFGIPALAPALFNIVVIAGGISLWALGVNERMAVIGWSVATLCGGLMQAAIQFPKLIALGWRPRITVAGWRESEGLKQIMKLMGAGVFSSIGIVANVLVLTILVSLLEQGAPSWLYYGTRLMQFPIGVFAVAIAVVTMPLISRDAANESMDGFRMNLTSSINFGFLLSIPCALGLWLLGVPIVRLIFEHGHFTATDTAATASTLAFFAIGIPAYATNKVISPSFFALKDAKSPVIASMAGATANIVFNLLTYQTLGYRGLALGYSVGFLSTFSVLVLLLHIKHGGLPYGKILLRLLQISVPALLMALSALYSYRLLHGSVEGIPGYLLETLSSIAISATVYFSVAKLFRIPETDLVWKAVKKISGRILAR